MTKNGTKQQAVAEAKEEREMEVKESEQPAITAEQAAEFLDSDRKRRVQACQKAIEAACRQHRCVIVPVMTLRSGQVEASLELVAQ